MEKPEKAIRKYAKSDLLLIEQAQTMLENFNEDIAEFTAKYPDMDAAYATAWQNAINAADAAPDDEEVVSDQKQKTETLIETMRQADNKYGALVTYLKLIHKDKAAGVLDHFGYKRLRRSRYSQPRMKELLDLAYERANSADYKAALIAKGFLQADIDELNALASQLNDENIEQEKSKTDRPEAAQERITLHNAVWDIMTEVNIASKVVFANDYARQQHYLLYPENNSGGGGSDAPFAASGTVGAGMVAFIDTQGVAIDANTPIVFKNNGAPQLQYYFEATVNSYPNPGTPVTTVNSGGTVEVTAGAAGFDVSRQKLHVSCAGPGTGAWSVEIG